MRRRSKRSLLVRLLVAYLLPTLALFAIFGWLAHQAAERSLEESLGRRLNGIALAASAQVRAEVVLFLQTGDDETRTARRLRHKLRQLKQRTRVARIFVMDPQLRSRCDTRDGVRIGDRYYQAEADRTELRRLFARGQEVSSVLFTGTDGRRYKAGYAPVLQQGRAVAAVGVEGSAEYFSTLAGLQRALLLGGAGVALLLMLTTVLVARRITGPLRALAREASRIGAGELEQPVAVTSRDEVGLLASTMNEMRQGLLERDTQMQMMLAGIAHEVRNPLGGIELFSGLLRDELQDLPQGEELLQHVGRIERELEHLKRVVGDFLDYARHRPADLSAVALHPLLQEVSELMRPLAEQREVALSVDGASQLAAHTDREQLRRVLLNLCRNALQATAPGGEVALSCTDEQGQAVVLVADTGSGIDEETQQQIFQPFFTTREKGTGLGLALAHKMVQQSQGEIALESTPGVGSTFRVTLPLASANPGADRPPE